MKDKTEKIKEILTRGVENIYPNRQDLEAVLRSGKKLRIYCGIDPTGKLHLGHGVVLGKLRQFQDLGHEVIILIGDFTATIGDPTGKYTTRKMLTRKQILLYAKNYKKEIRKILDFNKSNIRFLHNEKWTNKLRPIDMLAIASRFTVAGLLERDMFQRRIKAGGDVRVHEFLYPIFQAYDAVTMDVDMQIGGNDQTFNMLAGRTLMKKMKNKETFVLTTKLLVDPAGKKMGKTEGTVVSLDESPKEMYGKIMSWPDTLISLGFELCTRVPIDEMKKITNPRDAKAKLAWEIVNFYHNKKEADRAREEFNRVFREGKVPTQIKTLKISPRSIGAKELLVKCNLTKSLSEAQRLIEQGAVSLDKKILKDWRQKIKIPKPTILRVGKYRFVKIIP